MENIHTDVGVSCQGKPEEMLECYLAIQAKKRLSLLIDPEFGMT